MSSLSPFASLYHVSTFFSSEILSVCIRLQANPCTVHGLMVINFVDTKAELDASRAQTSLFGKPQTFWQTIFPLIWTQRAMVYY